MKKRLLAMLMTLCMVAACMALPVAAQENAAAQPAGAPQLTAEAQDGTEQNAQPQQIKHDTARVTLPTFDVPVRNAILVSADTGDVLYEKKADEPVPIASITKVMTLLLTLEAVQAGKITLDDIVPISEHAFNMGGSQIWLEPGEQFTLNELIKAICVCSANDAAVAVGEYVGGSEPVFAEMMNARAKELGMKNTQFKNACGLDEEGHYSSARDVALMSAALLQHPIILEYSGIWMDSLRGGQTQLVNTNKLLKSYPGITGLKTGTTSKAGVCISATATREGTSFIAVVLGANSAKERFAAATQLLDYGFATYENAEFPTMPDAPQALRVRGGALPEVELVYAVPASVLCRKGEGKTLAATYTLPEELDAPVEEGTPVGKIVLSAGETELAQYDIITQNTVEKMDFGTALSLLTKALLSL